MCYLNPQAIDIELDPFNLTFDRHEPGDDARPCLAMMSHFKNHIMYLIMKFHGFD